MRRRGTPTSARRYLDLVVEGKIDARDSWHVPQEIAGLLNTHAELRDYAGLLKEGTSPKAGLLAKAVAECRRDSRRAAPARGVGEQASTIADLMADDSGSRHGARSLRTLARRVRRTSRRSDRASQEPLGDDGDGGLHNFAARVLREIDRVRDETAPKTNRAILIWRPASRGRSSRLPRGRNGLRRAR